uniref:Aminopeptidase n=1 Tax=Gastrophysa viridula TaxID=154015 RepID=D9J2F4_GASVI|nr:aminopeptidase N [Gastrophysa viridula]
MHLLPLATLLLVTLAEATNVTDSYKGYRLPETQVPHAYAVDLHLSESVFRGNETAFSGSVMITFQVTESTSEIKLHSAVSISDVNILSSTNENISVMNFTTNATTEILTIRLDNTTLNVSTDYALTIKYVGQLDTSNMMGLYRSQYEDGTGTQYLVTTQFQPTNARRAFPCFDEPRYKATFVLSITHPTELQAVSNTPFNSDLAFNDSYRTTVFTKTPTMSTYLLAFTVSGFTCTSGQKIDTNVTHQVCSRPDTESDRALAADFGTKIMNTYGELFDYKYQDMNIGKIHQVALPDFDAGAMENWGMVTYKESALLYNTNHSSNAMKQRVISIVAHEFAHMWFGNLVTLDWWDHTFLNEGFARYFQYFVLTKIPELAGFDMDKQFVVEQQQTAFVADASKSSQSLTSTSATPSEISLKFGTISYNKGASVIRMLENVMGSENFIKSLQEYLKQNAYASSVPEKLWNVLANSTPSENLPSNVSFIEVVTNWSEKAGFPLVKVSTNGSDVILTQKRFAYSESEDTQWYIPISYTLSGDEEKFTNSSAHIWLRPNTTYTLSNISENNEWIILNNRASAYYRVNYDTSLWKAIRLVLQNNLTVIDRINRAQIVDDSLNLARAGEILYSEAFQTLSYLRNETCYYPWYSAIEGFNYLMLRFGEDSVLGKKVRSMVLDLMQSVKTMSLMNVNESEHINTLKLQKVLTVACKLGDESCVQEAKELFMKSKNGSASIDKNVRSIVYCNALRYSDDIDSDWEYLWSELRNTSQVNEISNLIISLGCTKSTKYLRYYLEQSVNASSGIRKQNLPDLWASVYGSSTEGVDVAFDFLSENHVQIYAYFSKASTLLSAVVERFTSESQLQKLQSFINLLSSNSSMRLTAEGALANANRNFKWVSDKREDLERHFGISPSAASGFKVTVFAMLSALIIPMMILN